MSTGKRMEGRKGRKGVGWHLAVRPRGEGDDRQRWSMDGRTDGRTDRPQRGMKGTEAGMWSTPLRIVSRAAFRNINSEWPRKRQQAATTNAAYWSQGGRAAARPTTSLSARG